MIGDIILVFVFAAILYFLYWAFTPFIQASSRPHPLSYDLTYVDVKEQLKDARGRYPRYPFETVLTEGPPVLHLSVVIPAPSDVQYLQMTLNNVVRYLKNRYEDDRTFSSEIVIVADATQNDTAALVLSYSKQYTSEFIRLLKLPDRVDTGCAVQFGALHTRGKYVLLLSSDDGAADLHSFQYLQDKLDKELYNGNTTAVAIGSRAHLQKSIDQTIFQRYQGKYPLIKQLQQKLTQHLDPLLGLQNIVDKTCGFKLFTRDAAKMLFLNQKLTSHGYHMEILYIANVLNIPIFEVPVDWSAHNLRNGEDIIKLNFTDVRDMILTWGLYKLANIWKVQKPQEHKLFMPSYEEKIGTFSL